MIDRNSATWREIAAWAESELGKASERIETAGVFPEETERLRGQILMLRTLLAMREPPEQRVVEPVDDYGFQGAGEAG
jgi:hypothetical protein